MTYEGVQVQRVDDVWYNAYSIRVRYRRSLRWSRYEYPEREKQPSGSSCVIRRGQLVAYFAKSRVATVPRTHVHLEDPGLLHGHNEGETAVLNVHQTVSVLLDFSMRQGPRLQ